MEKIYDTKSNFHSNKKREAFAKLLNTPSQAEKINGIETITLKPYNGYNFKVKVKLFRFF